MYPRYMVCFRYTIVNTLYRDDNMDDDDDDDDDNNNNNNNNTAMVGTSHIMKRVQQSAP